MILFVLAYLGGVVTLVSPCILPVLPFVFARADRPFVSAGPVVHRFHARDLHLVLGPAPESGPIRFRVTIDGKPPGDSHGTDIDADGQGTVTSQRLYQMIRERGAIADHTLDIRFLDPGVQAYAFTFG
jgi:hypothetical protein